MKALVLQKPALVSAFQAAHPLKDDPFTVYPPSKFVDYFTTCLATNEIIGMNFYEGDAIGFFGMPKYMSHISEVTVRKELLSAYNYPEHVPFMVSNRIEFQMRNFWMKEDYTELLSLTDIRDPFEIMNRSFLLAQEILARSPQTLGVVCGPMSSGVLSSEENFEVFIKTVFKIGQKMPMFNQLPFEPGFAVVHELIKTDPMLCPDGSSSKFFIDHFYEKLFRFSGKEWLPHFIYGYKHSKGAMMEHKIFTDLASNIHPLREGFADKLF